MISVKAFSPSYVTPIQERKLPLFYNLMLMTRPTALIFMWTTLISLSLNSNYARALKEYVKRCAKAATNLAP